METAKTKDRTDDFPGIILIADSIDLPPGAAQDQLNLKSDMPGQATVRLGMLPVNFDASS